MASLIQSKIDLIDTLLQSADRRMALVRFRIILTMARHPEQRCTAAELAAELGRTHLNHSTLADSVGLGLIEAEGRPNAIRTYKLTPKGIREATRLLSPPVR